MGDLNAKVGNYAGRETIMGKEVLGKMNENGELFTEFCGLNGLCIGGTLFAHRKTHKATWRSSDMTTENQIDHLAISQKWKRNLLDVRAYRSRQ